MSHSHEERSKFLEDVAVDFESIAGSVFGLSGIPQLGSAEKGAITFSAADRKHVQDTSGHAASVSGAGIQSFLPDVNRQQQQDVQNSLLLAQLGANAKVGPPSDQNAVQWYTAYTQILQQLGWGLQGFQFETVEAAMYSSASVLLLNRAAQYLSGPELAIYKATINSLSQTNNLASIGIFDRTAITGSKMAAFQVGVVSNDSGNPALNMTYSYYRADASITSTLFYQWAGKVAQFKTGNQRLVLNTQIYSRLRQMVINKLGANGAALIANLDISIPV